jgi:uroporphyrinogen-III decarboxylase
MELVAGLAGIAAVTYALSDAPEEFDETIAVLERKTEEAAGIALRSPAECLMIPENLSSEAVGKRLFHRYIRSYEERWARKIREAGKYSFVHMDGTLKGLIREVSSTGILVLEALTPAPVGDLAIEEMRDWVREDTIIWGGIPGLYFSDLVSDQEFDRFVIHVLEVMRSEPRYVLGVADQVPPGARWERIRRVSELVEQYGRYP